MKNPDTVKLKFTDQPHYTAGGTDTMEIISAKFSDEQYAGLCIGDVIRYTMRYLAKKNTDDLEKALTMLAWLVIRLRGTTHVYSE